MANEYYDHSSAAPENQSRALAAVVRNELDLIAAGFNKLPLPASLQSGSANYYAATGTATALAITGNSAVTAYADGQQYLVKTASASTGATTINVGGVGLVPVKRTDGSAIAAGDWALGDILALTYNSTSASFIFNQATAAQVTAAAGYAAAAAASATAAEGSATAAAGSASAAATSAGTAAAAVAAAKFGTVAYLNNTFFGI